METSNRLTLVTEPVERVMANPEPATVESSLLAASVAPGIETAGTSKQAQPSPSWLVACGVVPPLSLIALGFLGGEDSLLDVVIDSIGSGDHRPAQK